MNNSILIDSSFLYAVFHFRDKYHDQALAFNREITGVPLVPDIILPEVGFLFLRDLGTVGVGQFLKALIDADPQLIALTNQDIERAYEIAQTYPTAKFDLVDTCIMALAERLKITQVCTFDRRDFAIFRPKHCDYLELLP